MLQHLAGGVERAGHGTKMLEHFGRVISGHDHWPRANSMIWAGGGIRTGQVIGATNRLGEDVVDRRVGPQDFPATIYRHLGIGYENVTLPDQTGRPNHIV